MRKQFKNIDIYAGIHPQDGAKWIKDNGIVENWKTLSTSRFVRYIRKKTWRVWSTSTSQPVSLPIFVVRTR